MMVDCLVGDDVLFAVCDGLQGVESGRGSSNASAG
jgi:hypothetical protein